MSVQMLLGAVFAYNAFDKLVWDTYKMKVPEADYFSYAIPAVVSFILGLHFFSGRLKGEVFDERLIRRAAHRNTGLPYVLIAVGFFAGIVTQSLSSELAFVFYLLSGFKYVGVFIFILGDDKVKIAPSLLVYGSIIGSALATGMFHDLLMWSVMFAAILAVKYKPSSIVKLIMFLLALSLVAVLQFTKGEYRAATWSKGEEGGLDTFMKAYEANSQSKNFFAPQNLAINNVRINQGFILTNILKTVPEKTPFAKGEELKLVLQTAILPRVLAPNKLQAGDKEIFRKYSGIQLGKSTSMGLGALGDAYINFGKAGGCVFLFLLGFFYNQVLKRFGSLSRFYPFLILFIPLVFIYPIRAETDLQTSLGHLFKACFLIYVVVQFWKKYFKAEHESLNNTEVLSA